jgi:tetratricopeptide (TPR) repeat protein
VRMRHFGYLGVLAAAFSLSTGIAAANCQLAQLGLMPIEMQGLRPTVWTKINGVKARFMVDSGAFYSTISRDAATQYKLPVTPTPRGAFYVTGIGGSEKAEIATADSFEFLGAPLTNIRFLTVEQSFGDMVGVIGQNLLRISDVEFDLANGIVRFIKPVGCGDQPLAYWAVSTPYSSVDLKYMDLPRSQLRSTAMVNGKRITVLFDTGAFHSLLSLEAAQRLGITPDSPGVTFLGIVSGIGPAADKVWIAPAESFQIGGEKVEHTHLPIGKLGPDRQIGQVGDAGPDMLLGADFFLSHRIFVAYSQKKLYFTYNGGPLFDLDVPRSAAAVAANGPATSSGTSPAGTTTDDGPTSDAPTDADGFKRRGMAYASMREFDRALADLTHACELAPQDAENHQVRGSIYAADRQFKLALQDFNSAIALQSDDIDALLARAELLQSHPEVDPAAAEGQVRSDLDTVSRLAPPGSDARQTLGDLYGKLGDYAAATREIDEWGSHHPMQHDQVTNLNNRCWLLASENRDLHEALDDCNRALAARPYAAATTGTLIGAPLASEDPDVLDSRGLVYIRLGNFKDAVHDYDSALQINPKMPTALYGRGVAELRLGETPQGEADLAAAAKLDSGVTKSFTDMGLPPK